MKCVFLNTLILVAIGAVTPSSCFSDDPADRPIRIARVDTELQRRLLGDDADWYVLMNPAAIIVDGQITDDAPGWQSLKEALSELKPPEAEAADDDTPPRIHILFAFSNENLKLMRQNDRYRRRAAQVIRAAGCRDVSVRDFFTTTRLKWRDHLAEFDAPESSTEDELSEPEEKSETVSVYPVRTRLSRYITSGSDCFVDFRRSLDESGGVVAPESLDEAVLLITRLKLEQPRTITFCVTGEMIELSSTKSILETVGIPPELPADLGFEHSEVWRR